MIIDNITTTKTDEYITLSASIQFDGSVPQTMFFSTPLHNEAYIAEDATPFLAAVLLPCMKTGENILIKDSVSKQFLKNAEQIMDLVIDWNIGCRKIIIHADTTKEDGFHADKTSSYFSGGVDSFYTYLKHNHEINDFILVHGFDIPLANTRLYNSVLENIENIAKDEHKHVLSVQTNIADIVERKLVWEFSHGGALAAVALFLRKKIKTAYVAGAVRDDELFPYGTHPQLDPLWSTETLMFKHDGTEYNRSGKILNSIVKSDLALRNLRVCTQNILGSYNCSRCYKCLTTMITLMSVEVQDKASTFHWPINLKYVRNMYYDYSLSYNDQGEANLELIKKTGKNKDLQAAIAYSLEKSKNPGIGRRIYKMIAQFDQNYNNRRLYTAVFGLTQKQDRNLLFKILFRRGILK
jgi:hypothetical protein